MISDPQHLEISQQVSGMDRLTIGGAYAKLQEPGELTISQAYKLNWEREYLDLAELARLRWIEEWKIERLAGHFEVSRTAIKERLRRIKNNPKRAGLDFKIKPVRDC